MTTARILRTDMAVLVRGPHCLWTRHPSLPIPPDGVRPGWSVEVIHYAYIVSRSYDGDQAAKAAEFERLVTSFMGREPGQIPMIIPPLQLAAWNNQEARKLVPVAEENDSVNYVEFHVTSAGMVPAEVGATPIGGAVVQFEGCYPNPFNEFYEFLFTILEGGNLIGGQVGNDLREFHGSETLLLKTWMGSMPFVDHFQDAEDIEGLEGHVCPFQFPMVNRRPRPAINAPSPWRFRIGFSH